MKNIKFMSLFLTVIMALGFLAPTGSSVFASTTNHSEDKAAVVYNKKTGSIDVNQEFKNRSGMTDRQVRMLQNDFNNLPQKEKKQILEKNGNNLGIAPLIAWAIKVLAAAGLSWLAKKLLDWGARKFCKKYRKTNWATKKVCSVIG